VRYETPAAPPRIDEGERATVAGQRTPMCPAAAQVGELRSRGHGAPEITRAAVAQPVDQAPSSSEAICAPLTRLAIFCIAISRAKSGDPWAGFSSRENGENPQSSVAPS